MAGRLRHGSQSRRGALRRASCDITKARSAPEPGDADAKNSQAVPAPVCAAPGEE